MAKTNFNNRFKVNPMEYAYTTTDHDLITAGSSIPMYVPAIMPNVSSGEPKIQKRTSRGSTVFKNAPTCKPRAKQILNTQNYLTPTMYRNQTWEGLSRKRGEDEYYVPRKTGLLCSSATGSPKNMNFSTDLC